jgi:hypothetical protein
MRHDALCLLRRYILSKLILIGGNALCLSATFITILETDIVLNVEESRGNAWRSRLQEVACKQLRVSHQHILVAIDVYVETKVDFITDMAA